MRRRATILACLVLAAWSAGARAQPSAALDPATRALAIDEQIARALERIERAEARKARVDAEIEGLGDRRAAAQRRLRARTRALYRLTRAGMLPLAGGFPALLTHLARVERLERMVGDDLGALGNLRRRGEILRAETGDLAAEIARAREELHSLEERKNAYELDLRTADAFAHAFETSSPTMPALPQPSYGTLRVIDDGDDGGLAFVGLRGRLPMPVSGAVDIRQAQREDGPGLDFMSPPGTPVRAVAQGRVAFSDRYGSYGRLVILDHGGSYFTVYGGLGNVDVRVGDVVSRGARVGDVGHDHRPSALFFEVRQGTRTLDAVSWLGL